jgi:aspartokinase-like uncharacterized kinase
MERVTIDDKTVWPNPGGPEFANVAWRLRYAQDHVSKADMLNAASVMEAYAYLITELTLEKSRDKIRGIRAVI